MFNKTTGYAFQAKESYNTKLQEAEAHRLVKLSQEASTRWIVGQQLVSLFSYISKLWHSFANGEQSLDKDANTETAVSI